MTSKIENDPIEQTDLSLDSTQRGGLILESDLMTTLLAIILALLVGAILIAFLGGNPIEAYGALLDGAIGSKNSFAETLVKAIPLALAGVGVSIAFRASVFNVGAEGQLYLGAIMATWVGLLGSNLPRLVIIPLMIISGMAAGAVWASIAGILKVWLKSSELINTIMMNYIAIFFVNYLVHGPLQEPGSPLGQTSPLPLQARLLRILPGTRLHAGIIIVVIVVIIAYIMLWRTTWGFQIRVTGLNPDAARSAGIKVNWATLSSLMLSGALAGIAGFSEAAGVHFRMIENISPGYGYTAIVVALLGRTNPPAVLAAAVLFAALQVGASTMESAVGVPSSIATIIQYLIVLLIMGRGIFVLLRNKYSQIRMKD